MALFQAGSGPAVLGLELGPFHWGRRIQGLVLGFQLQHTILAAARPILRFEMYPGPAEHPAGDIELVEYALRFIGNQGQAVVIAFDVTGPASMKDDIAQLGTTAHRRMAGRAGRCRAIGSERLVMLALHELPTLFAMALSAGVRLVEVMQCALPVIHVQDARVRFF